MSASTPLCTRGYGNRLVVAQQHPLRLLIFCIEGGLWDFWGVVGKVLVTEQYTVLIESCRKNTNTALEVMVYTDAHGRNVPVIAEAVSNGAAVARAGGKSTGFGRERIACLQGERSQRMVAHIDTVTRHTPTVGLGEESVCETEERPFRLH